MDTSRSNLWNTPTTVLDRVAERVNRDRIQENALNDTSNTQWQYASEYKITNTLDALRVQITPYIQWTMFIGLSLAVILLIYNGFLMVTNWLHGEWDTSKVKTRIMNIIIGVVLLTWFYIIIQVGLAAIEYILQ